MISTTTYPMNEMSPVDALWTLIQGQTKAVRAALTKRLVEQQAMWEQVDDAHAVELTERVAALKDDPKGFFKLGGVLGRPREGFSWEQLREESVSEKYGI